MKQLIPKYQSGRGLMRNNQQSGSWGNRGKGNELQSAFENGTTWVLQLPEKIGNLLSNRGFKTDQEVTKQKGYNPNTHTSDGQRISGGTAPVPGGKINNQVTQNLLKFLGNSKVKGPKINPNDLSNNELMLYSILKERGVDLSKFSAQDLSTLINKRIQVLLQTKPNRATIVTNSVPNKLRLNDIKDKRVVGSTTIDIENVPVVSETHNLTRFLPDKQRISGTYERALNSGIQSVQSLGYPYLVSGQTLESAPLQYHVLQKFKDRNVLNYNGIHNNSQMVRPPQNSIPARSMLDLRRADSKVHKSLIHAPVWKLNSTEEFVPTKADVFDPSIIDSEGKMHIDWTNPNILKFLIPAGIYGTMENYNEK